MAARSPRQPNNLRIVPGLLDASRAAVAAALARAADWGAPLLAVDATCGNGHDSCFLARTLRAGMPEGAYAVLSFDVQPVALAATRELLERNGLAEQVFLLRQSHDSLKPALARHVAGWSTRLPPLLATVMYNLGFLPGSDKRVVTSRESTLVSLGMAAEALAPGGLLAVHAYGGHAGGSEELDAVRDWCSALPYQQWIVAAYAICNKPRNPEMLFLAEKQGNAG